MTSRETVEDVLREMRKDARTPTKDLTHARGHADASGYWADRIERALAGRAEAVAWIRFYADGSGCYEGPIHNSQMDDIRRRSGKWTPLCTHPPASVPEVTEWIDKLDGVIIYGTDTLSGPAEPVEDRGRWDRDGIREMVRRARELRAALTAALQEQRHD